MMELDRYLARIGYEGPVDVDARTLNGVVEAHAFGVTYENLDVYLEVPVTTSVDAALTKVVDQRRGGWCYEQNGTLGWALEQIGFDVTRMAGAVGEAESGPELRGNHLVLRVDLEEPWVADVGLGGALIRPFRLEEGSFTQGWREFRVEQIDGSHWRFHNWPGALPPSFDWCDAPADEDALSAMCQQLQDDEESIFRQNLVVMACADDTALTLLGKVVFDTRHGTQETIESEQQLLDTLTDRFGLALPADTSTLWDRVEERHAEMFGG